MSAVQPLERSDNAARLQVDYVSIEGMPIEGSDTASLLPTVLAQADTLAVLGFGTDAAASADPRYLHVPLQPHGAATLEIWRSQGPVTCGIDDGIRWSADGMLQFGVVEIDEAHFDAHGNGIEAASAAAYARMHAFVRSHGYPHQLRIWNHLDAITAGDGDEERYRRFCLGRAAGLGHFDTATLPAASAIGRRDGVRTLQVYWLAARVPGTPIENPRQVSAYRYPRQYGPQSPSFARAMLPPSVQMPMLLSGTASVVGHESRHHDCIESQLAETFANFDSLIAAARERRPALPAHFGPGSRLKVYVRDAEHLPRIAAALDALLGPSVPRLLLHAAICRRELQVEIDGVHS